MTLSPDSQVVMMIRRHAANRIICSCVIVAMVRATTSCPLVGPAGAWPPGIAYKAVSAGKPNVSVPLKVDGFNRTAEVKGLCTPGVLNSGDFIGKISGHELSARVKTTSKVSMTFGGATCWLTAVTMYKTTQPAAFRAEFRMQFDNCVGGPLNLSMALVAGLSEDISGASSANVLKWVREVLPKEVTTPPPPPVQITTNIKTSMTLIGNGTCVGKEVKKIHAITNKDLCGNQCTASYNQAKITGQKDGCRGFAFHGATATCIIYSGVVVKSNKAAPHADQWRCFNMSIHQPHIHKHTASTTTTKAPTMSDLDFLQAQVFSQRPLAFMTQINAPWNAPTCFNPTWWFRLQDQAGSPLAIPIKSAEFNQLFKKLPAADTKKYIMSAPMVIDRVTLDACNFKNHWGRTICFVPTQKKNPICSTDSTATAIVTGCFTAIGTWLLVAVVFFLINGASRPRKDYEQLHNTDRSRSTATCSAMVLLIVCIAALGGACLTSWGGFQLVTEILRSQTCYDFDEVLVIILASMLAAAVAIIIFLQYVAHVHPTHEHPLITNPNPSPKPETKLILVEVNEGEKVGHPVPVNTQMATGNGTGTLTLGSTSSPNSTQQSFFSSAVRA